MFGTGAEAMRYPIEELHTVIGLWIKAARKARNHVPKPSNRAGRTHQAGGLIKPSVVKPVIS